MNHIVFFGSTFVIGLALLAAFLVHLMWADAVSRFREADSQLVFTLGDFCRVSAGDLVANSSFDVNECGCFPFQRGEGHQV